MKTLAVSKQSLSQTEINKSIVRRFNKEFIEGADINVFNEIIAPGFINHSAPQGVPKGPEGVLYFFNNFLRPSFPDLKVEIVKQVAENDLVTTHKIFHVTHKGEFMGVAATGRSITIEVIDIIRLKDKRFIEHWNVLDWQQVMTHLAS